jgi:hypothetical protein
MGPERRWRMRKKVFNVDKRTDPTILELRNRTNSTKTVKKLSMCDPKLSLVRLSGNRYFDTLNQCLRRDRLVTQLCLLFGSGGTQVVLACLRQGALKGEVSLYCWPPVWLDWNQLYDNWQFLFLFEKQTNPTGQTLLSTKAQWTPHPSPPFQFNIIIIFFIQNVVCCLQGKLQY